MKVLFICLANIGRSQMAAEFYNQLTNTLDAESAGVDVQVEGETLQQRRDRKGGVYVIDAMDEEGIDVRDNASRQLTPAMLDEYQKIVNIAGKKFSPKWLLDYPRVINWEIEDPGGKGLEETVIARDLIKQSVKDFIKSVQTTK